MKRLLITGGAGFIGANFIHCIAQQHPSGLCSTWTNSPTLLPWTILEI